MDDPWTGVTPREPPMAPEPPRGPIYVLGEHDPLPDGVSEGDEGVFVIRLVAATREMVEAERAAKMEAENAA